MVILAPKRPTGITAPQGPAWGTIFRRDKPLTPSPHLVSYLLLVDRSAGSVLLCDHRLSGLWLPTGGHVEPGEHPLGTVRREAVEELGVTVQPDAAFGDRPFFLTMTAGARIEDTRGRRDPGVIEGCADQVGPWLDGVSGQQVVRPAVGGVERAIASLAG